MSRFVTLTKHGCVQEAWRDLSVSLVETVGGGAVAFVLLTKAGKIADWAIRKGVHGDLTMPLETFGYTCAALAGCALLLTLKRGQILDLAYRKASIREPR